MNHETPIQDDAFIEDTESNECGITAMSRNDVGWLLVGGGAAGLFINLLLDKRGFFDLVIPLGLVGLGSGVLLQHRQSNMDEAEENILAELDALDPVARAQVLKAVAKEEFGRIPGVGS